MHIMPSSSRARRAFSSVRVRLVVVVSAVAILCSAALLTEAPVVSAGEPLQMAHLSEETLPAEDLPSVVATPAAGSPGEWVVVPASGSTVTGPASESSSAPEPDSTESSASPEDTDAAQVPTAAPTPADVAPLEVGSIAPQGQISDASLDSLVQHLSGSNPALAASLRITDQARDEILKNRDGDAIETLTRAVSIDGSNPYAYFYLGRAYLGKKNYDQALTFLTRAETHFGGNPQWLGETLAFEGLVNEQSGQTAPAIACYQKALVAVPGNLMARVGLTRLNGGETAPAIQPASAPVGPNG